MKRTVKESINQRYLLVKTEEELIKVLNPKITGWRNYYKTRNDRNWMRAIDWYILCSFCRWNNKKRQQTRKLKGLYATKLRLQEKGLQLMAAWRNAVERRMSESRMRENLTYGLMRGKRAKPSDLLYTSEGTSYEKRHCVPEMRTRTKKKKRRSSIQISLLKISGSRSSLLQIPTIC